MNDPTNPDPGTAAGRIDTWLTAWKHHYGDLGIPFGASLIAGPPPTAEPRACADDFGVLLETLAVVLADRAAETVRAEKAEARLDALTHIKTEWSTDNTFGPPEDSITNEKLAFGRAAHRPDIHTGVLARKIYAGPWLAAGGVVSADNAPVLDGSGCTYTLPSRAEVEADGREESQS